MLKLFRLIFLIFIFLLLVYSSPNAISNTNTKQEFSIHKYRDSYQKYIYGDNTNKELEVQLNITGLNDAKIYLLFANMRNIDNSLNWVILKSYNLIGNYSEKIKASNLRIEIADVYYEEHFTNRSAQGSYSIIDTNLNEIIENNSFLLGVSFPERQNVYSRMDHGTWNYNISIILENITVKGGLLAIDFYWWGGLDSGGDFFPILENDYLDEWKVTNKAQSAHLNLVIQEAYSSAHGWYTVIDHGELSTAIRFDWLSGVLPIICVILLRKLKKLHN